MSTSGVDLLLRPRHVYLTAHLTLPMKYHRAAQFWHVQNQSQVFPWKLSDCPILSNRRHYSYQGYKWVIPESSLAGSLHHTHCFSIPISNFSVQAFGAFFWPNAIFHCTGILCCPFKLSSHALARTILLKIKLNPCHWLSSVLKWEHVLVVSKTLVWPITPESPCTMILFLAFCIPAP